MLKWIYILKEIYKDSTNIFRDTWIIKEKNNISYMKDKFQLISTIIIFMLRGLYNFIINWKTFIKSLIEITFSFNIKRNTNRLLMKLTLEFCLFFLSSELKWKKSLITFDKIYTK